MAGARERVGSVVWSAGRGEACVPPASGPVSR